MKPSGLELQVLQIYVLVLGKTFMLQTHFLMRGKNLQEGFSEINLCSSENKAAYGFGTT